MALANLLADNKQDRKTVPPPKLKRLVPQARSRKTEGVPDQTYGMPDRTLLVFDTDACIRLYPYFRAILEFDETEDCEDYEQIGIFVTATVMAELGQMTLRPSRKLKLARSLLQLIQSNVREKNPQIIKQSYAYAHEMRYSQSALVKDKLIREQAKLLQAYGAATDIHISGFAVSYSTTITTALIFP